ncbi:hypothetical protein MA13_contig00005-0076 [Edwardsiella piscicida]|nr:hypothetical protein MA13_contig00005-0076 [Edwardsiella piscicida]
MLDLEEARAKSLSMDKRWKAVEITCKVADLSQLIDLLFYINQCIAIGVRLSAYIVEQVLEHRRFGYRHI